jgi:hypothetical protein
MKKLFAIAALISSSFLTSCEKEPVDINGFNTNTSIIGGGWCRPAVEPVIPVANTDHQTNDTANPHPGTKRLKGKQ